MFGIGSLPKRQVLEKKRNTLAASSCLVWIPQPLIQGGSSVIGNRWFGGGFLVGGLARVNSPEAEKTRDK